jgi:hypothetical protein
MFKFYRPSENLGCPGLKIGSWFYADYFNSWGSRGFFIRFREHRFWIYFSGHIKHIIG